MLLICWLISGYLSTVILIWLCTEMFSSKREQRGCEQLLGGENIPKFRGRALLSGVFAHGCESQRQLPWNFDPTINLRRYSDHPQGPSPSCLLRPPGFAGQTLPRHLWSSPLQGRVIKSFPCILFWHFPYN